MGATRVLWLALVASAGCADSRTGPEAADVRAETVMEAAECDCIEAGTCESAEQLAQRLCEGESEAVTLKSFADCEVIGVGRAAHHWASTHWFGPSGELLGYDGADGFVGFSEHCGERPPPACSERSSCTLCRREDLRWEPPPLCASQDEDAGAPPRPEP